MIGLENFYKLRHSKDPFESYDQIWVVMRAPREIPTGWKHVPELAPSRGLFCWAQQAKHDGHWDKNTFDAFYVPRYIKELAANPDGMTKFQELLSLSDAGQRIAVVCSCHRQIECHTSIIAGIIQGMRPDIEVKCDADYSEYWNRMKDL